MGSIDWDQLISERNVWVAHNFPDPLGKRTPLDSMLGVIEELGELVHHHLKQAQSIRGSQDHHEAEAKDAIGDLTVYLLGIMAHYRVTPTVSGPNSVRELPWLSEWEDGDFLLLHLAREIGRLCINPKEDAEPHAVEYMVNGIVRRLWTYCCCGRGWDYPQIVQQTWNEVKQRDWIKYPDTGLPPMEKIST